MNLQKINKEGFCFFRALTCAIIILSTTTVASASPGLERGDEFFRRGEFGKAGKIFERAIAGMDKARDIKSYVVLCLKLAECCKALGYHKRAMPFFKAAIPFLKKCKNSYYTALFLVGLADLRQTLGEPEKSLKHLKNALELAERVKNPRLLATVLNAAGNIATWSRDFETGLQYYGKAFETLDSVADADRLKTEVLLNRTRLLVLSKKKNAVKELEKVISLIEKLPDGYFKASCLLSADTIAEEIQEHDNIDVSGRLLKKALAVARGLGNAKLISRSCGRLGGLYESAGELERAEDLTRQAMFFARKSDAPEILYLWQWQMGRIFAARNDFKGAMGHYEKAVATLNPIRTGFFSGYRYKRDFFNAKVRPVYLGLAELLIRRASESRDKEVRKKRLLAVINTMEALKTAELEDYFRDECTVAAGKKRVQSEQMPDNAVLLYPISLRTSLAVLATFPDGMEYSLVRVTRKKLVKTAKRLRMGLQNGSDKTFVREAGNLYTWLIAPFEKKLERCGTDTLIIAPDGVLRLIPFSALYDGENFLVEKYAVATIPAVNLMNFGKFDFTEKKCKILLTGLSDGVQGFSPLPGVKDELRDIKEIMNASVFYADEECNLANLQRELQTEAYSVVHMATHGVFGYNAENTFLLLYDEKLDMNQLANLLRTEGSGEKPVELLTLSACQTALGDDRAALGLAGVAVKAGVKSVAATLWFVDDEAASLVIREFYRQLKLKIPKAKALQNAQKKLMVKKRYRHPAYWAPFLLIGDWR